MTINFEELFTVQVEILKSFSPKQEYAMLNLKLDSDVSQDVVFLAQNVLHSFPTFAKMYDGFAAHNHDDSVCPFIVPVSDSDSVMADILDTQNGQLVVSSALMLVLNYAYERIPKREYTLDEIDQLKHMSLEELASPVNHGSNVTGQIVNAIVAGLRFGNEPIVIRPTPKQRAARWNRVISNSTLAKLFFVAA